MEVLAKSNLRCWQAAAKGIFQDEASCVLPLIFLNILKVSVGAVKAEHGRK